MKLLSPLSKIQRPKAYPGDRNLHRIRRALPRPGMPEGGTPYYTIERQSGVRIPHSKYIALTGLQNKIHLHIGDALSSPT